MGADEKEKPCLLLDRHIVVTSPSHPPSFARPRPSFLAANAHLPFPGLPSMRIGCEKYARHRNFLLPDSWLQWFPRYFAIADRLFASTIPAGRPKPEGRKSGDLDVPTAWVTPVDPSTSVPTCRKGLQGQKRPNCACRALFHLHPGRFGD